MSHITSTRSTPPLDWDSLVDQAVAPGAGPHRDGAPDRPRWWDGEVALVECRS